MKNRLDGFVLAACCLMLAACGTTITAKNDAYISPGTHSFTREAKVNRYISGPIVAKRVDAVYHRVTSGTAVSMPDLPTQSVGNDLIATITHPVGGDGLFRGGDRFDLRWQVTYREFGSLTQATSSSEQAVYVPHPDQVVLCNQDQLEGGEVAQCYVRLNFPAASDVRVELRIDTSAVTARLSSNLVTIPANGVQSELFDVMTEECSGTVVGLPGSRGRGVAINATVTIAGETVTKEKFLRVNPTEQ